MCLTIAFNYRSQYDMKRKEKKCYSDMRSEAYMSQINLQHGTTTDREEQEEWKTKE